MITQTYNLSMIPCGVNPVVRVSQYDDNSRIIVFNLTNNDYEIENAEVVIDGQTVESSIEDGKVQFIVYLDQTSESGVKRGEVRLGEIGSLNFKFYVEKTPLAVDSAELNRMMSNSLNLRQNASQRLENLSKLDGTTNTEGMYVLKDGEWVDIDEVKEKIEDLKVPKEELEPIKKEEIEEMLEKEAEETDFATYINENYPNENQEWKDYVINLGYIPNEENPDLEVKDEETEIETLPLESEEEINE